MVKEFTKGSKNNSSTYESLSKGSSKPILAVQPMMRIKEPEKNEKQPKHTKINQHGKYLEKNFVNSNLFMVKESLKFRISCNSYEKITKHETEIPNVKRKVAEVLPFVEEKPLDLSMKKNTNVKFNPMSLINHECSTSNQLEFSKELEKGQRNKYFNNTFK